MSKFIPKHKDLSSQSQSGASMTPEPESVSEGEVQPDEENQEPSPNLLLTKCRQGSMTALNGLKRLSGFALKSFTGPKPIYRRPWFWVGLGVSGSAIALGWGWYELDKSVPDSTADVLTYVRDDTITIKASDGSIIQQVGPATRETVKVSEVPKPLIQAFIASEDQRFDTHSGIDVQGILRAAVSNLMAGGVVEGGSTLTQQLARIVYFDQERSLWRKLKEMRMAQKIEEDLDKNQILERYLNLVYLGSGAYGVEDAAWVYFSKTVKDLTLPEMAMLAGLPPAPSVYSPFVNENAARSRRDRVLRRMQEVGFITKAQADDAIAKPLNTKRSNPKRLDRQAYYFTEYIQQELPKFVSKEVWARKGLTVETTLNLEWQTAAEEAVKETIEESGRWQRFEQAALVAIDPRNGQIKAMVGGKDFYDQQFNRVTQAKRQPGSTFKTFVYATGIAAGFSPYRSYLDAPFVVDGYEPKNYSENFRGWLTIRDALTNSINVVAVKALIDIGWNPIIEIAHKMGIESELHSTYSLALGASEVNLLEMTSAYGTLAAKGIHTKPQGIHRILDRRGNVIYEQNVKRVRAIDEETSAIMTWMLRTVVTNGTGRAAQIGRPVAGKTGTTDEARDLWFIGYIPQIVAGVWLGNDDNKPTWGSSGTAAATWRKFMAEVVEDMDVEEFPDRPNQLEGRKGIIKIQRLRPKRAIDKKIPDSQKNSERASRRNSVSTYSSTASQEAPRESRRSRRRRRYNSETANQNQSEQPTRTSRRRSRRNTASSYSAPRQSESRQSESRQSRQRQSESRQSESRQSRRRQSESRQSESRQSESRQSRRRRQTYQPAPQPARPAAAPAARVEQRFEPAPVAPPPAPPSSRKAESAAPAPEAPAAPGQ